MSDYTEILSPQSIHTQMKHLPQSKGWKVSEDSFWRMHWRTDENSIFVANCDVLDPHAFGGSGLYCVESYGPDVASSEDVDFWYFNDLIEAMDRVLNLMDKDSR